MAGLVLDASVVLASILPGEVNADRAHALMAEAMRRGIVVPALWPVEVGNALLVQQRRGHLPNGGVPVILNRLSALRAAIDTDGLATVWDRTLALAWRHRLTLYDVAYLEPALRRALPLAGFGAGLRRAAHRAAVAVLGLPV